MTVPVAYVRRSSRASKASDGEISLAAQEAAVRDLAQRDGYNGQLVIFTDAGRSGDEAKIGKRSAYARMLGMIERGEVSELYAYSLDRLHRSVIATTRLVRAAEERGVRIVTQREGEVRNDSPDEWLRWTILATFGDYELQVAKARARGRSDAQRARGDYLGVVPFGYQRIDGRLAPNPAEDIAAVHAAYREAGSFMGAAQLLNAREVPSRRGKWADQTIARILRREGLIPAGGDGLPRHRVEHYLFRLLKCPHCGTILTPQRKHGRADWSVYFCGNARRDKAHPRPYAVSESKLLDWVKVEAAKFRAPGSVILAGADARRDELEEDRRRAGVAYNARAMSDEEFSAIVARIDAALDGLETAEAAVAVPQAIDWQRWERGAVNAVLRALWKHVALDARMQPVRAVWRVPGWRA